MQNLVTMGRRGGGRGEGAGGRGRGRGRGVPPPPKPAAKRVPPPPIVSEIPKAAPSSAAGGARGGGGGIKLETALARVDAKAREHMRSAVARFQSQAPRYEIEGVTFNFMSKEMIEALSVVECASPALVGNFSINSPRMGSVDQSIPCGTCKLTGINCLGHLGHIKLAVPIPHPQARDYLIDILKSVCFNCGRLLLPAHKRDDPAILRLRGGPRWRMISNIVSSTHSTPCPRNTDPVELAKEGFRPCSTEPTTFEFPKNAPDEVRICMSSKKKSGNNGGIPPYITMSQVLTLFNSISAEDLAVLGFSGDSHPKNFIMQVLPVIPERNRVPLERDNEIRHDHISLVYSTIIRRNKVLRDLILHRDDTKDRSKESDISVQSNWLYFYISHLQVNSDGRLKLGHQDLAMTVGHRLGGKEGMCRSMAQGRRCNGCARSVAGGGVMPLGAIMMPGESRVLTIPERVTVFNIDRIKKLAKDGEVIHLTRAGGEHAGVRLRLPSLIADARAKGLPDPEIEVGDLINRMACHDEVFIVRQPTLHRHSLIGCRTIFVPGQKTLRAHMSCTPGQNLDFDGDEENAQIIQTVGARAEIRHILALHKQLISAANSQPITGNVFNCPTTAYLLSKDADEDEEKYGKAQPIMTVADWEAHIDELLFDRTYANTLNRRLDLEGVPRRSPRAFFSLALPPTFYYRRKYKVEVRKQDVGGAAADDFDDEESEAEARKRIAKEIAEGNDDDTGDAKDEFEEVEKVILIRNGVFIKGRLTKKDVVNGIIHAMYMKYGADVTGRYISEAQYIFDAYYEMRGFSIGLKDCLLSDSKAATREIQATISKARIGVDALKRLPMDTDTAKEFREAEIRSRLQTVSSIGVRLAKTGLLGENNSLANMVASGSKGKPENIAQITAALGVQLVNGERPAPRMYGNRTLPCFEDGDDSIEARGFVKHSFAQGLAPDEEFFHMMGTRVGLLDTAMKTADSGTISRKMQKVLENDRVNFEGAVVGPTGIYTSLCYGEGYNPSELILVNSFPETGEVYMPIDLNAVIEELNDEDVIPKSNDEPRDLTSAEIEEIVSVVGDVRAAISTVARHNTNEIRDKFRRQLSVRKLRPSKFLKLRERVYNRCRRAHVAPGATVGLHSAEAIAEKLSQATLNTFHSSGSASGSAQALGVHVFSEVLNQSQNRKTKMAYIHLKKQKLSLAAITNLARAFKATDIQSLLTDPIGGIEFIRLTEEDEIPKYYNSFLAFIRLSKPNFQLPEVREAPFVRLKFDKYRLLEARVTTRSIASAIEEGDGVICIFSPTSADEPFVDIHVIKNSLFVKKELASRKKEEDKKEQESERRIARFNQIANRKESEAAQLAAANALEAANAAQAAAIEEMEISHATTAASFIQMMVIPRIMSKQLSVYSQIATNALERSAVDANGGKNVVIPHSSSILAHYRHTTPLEIPITKLIRSQTKNDDGTIRLWFNVTEILSVGIPISAITDLVQIAYPAATFERIGPNETYVDVSGIPMSQKVAKEINSRVEKEKSAWSATRAKAQETASDLPFPPAPPIVAASTYRYIVAKGTIAPRTLRMLIVHPAIENRFTSTNNFQETTELRGIEVARATVMRELYDLVRGTGSTVNPRHIQCIADVMAGPGNGTLMPFTARGNIRQQYGAFSDSSFEQAVPAFKRSAASSMPEPVSATSTGILIGAMQTFGTGAYRVFRSGGAMMRPAWMDKQDEANRRAAAESAAMREAPSAAVADAIAPVVPVDFAPPVPPEVYNRRPDYFSDSALAFPPSDDTVRPFFQSLRETTHRIAIPPPDEVVGALARVDMLPPAPKTFADLFNFDKR